MRKSKGRRPRRLMYRYRIDSEARHLLERLAGLPAARRSSVMREDERRIANRLLTAAHKVFGRAPRRLRTAPFQKDAPTADEGEVALRKLRVALRHARR